MASGYLAVVDGKVCDRKAACPAYRNCPAGAISYGHGQVAVNAELCTGCGRCQAACPRRAISLIPRS